MLMTDTSESNYPVKAPIGERLTRDLVNDVAKVLEGHGGSRRSAPRATAGCIWCCTTFCTRATGSLRARLAPVHRQAPGQSIRAAV